MYNGTIVLYTKLFILLNLWPIHNFTFVTQYEFFESFSFSYLLETVIVNKIYFSKQKQSDFIHLLEINKKK